MRYGLRARAVIAKSPFLASISLAVAGLMLTPSVVSAQGICTTWKRDDCTGAPSGSAPDTESCICAADELPSPITIEFDFDFTATCTQGDQYERVNGTFQGCTDLSGSRGGQATYEADNPCIGLSGPEEDGCTDASFSVKYLGNNRWYWTWSYVAECGATPINMCGEIEGDCGGGSSTCDDTTVTITVSGGECVEADEGYPDPCSSEPTECPDPENGSDCDGDDACDEESDQPVSLLTGNKIERAVDLRIALTGDDFSLTREYVSNPDAFFVPAENVPLNVASGEVGANWLLSTTKRITGRGGDVEKLYITGTPLRSYRVFEKAGPIFWQASGQSKDTVTYGLDVGYIWQQPDGAYTLFGEDELYAVVTEERDPYGNLRLYIYGDITSDDPMEQGVRTRRRLQQISFKDPTGVEEARLVFTWHAWSSSGIAVNDHVFARPQIIEVKRPDGQGGWFTTQKAEYRYFVGGGYSIDHDGNGTVDETVVFDNDFGTDGDLCEVIVSTLVDYNYADTSDPFHRKVWQYRYHEEPFGLTIDGTILSGKDHQLLAVFSPEQVEFYADVLGAATTPFTTVTDAAKLLRGLPIDTAAGTDTDFPASSHWTTVWDLSAKLVGYYSTGDNDGRVSVQMTMGGCGCGGGSGQGQRFDYNYFEYTWNGAGLPKPGLTCQILESVSNNGSYDPYRIHFHDFVRIDGDGGAAYRRAYAVAEAAAASTPADVVLASPSEIWATVHEYAMLSSASMLYKTKTARSTPASSSYTPLEDSPWVNGGLRAWADVSIKASEGLVHRFEYFDEVGSENES